MEITQIANMLNLTSPATAGHSYVHVIDKITTSSESQVNDTIVDSTSSYELTSDGYYKVIEIRLPNTVSAGNYYTLDGDFFDTSGDQITLAELLEVESGVTRTDTNHLSYYYLDTYYLNLIKSKFLKNICGCSCSSQQDRITIDTLTMGLHLIASLGTYLQYYEATRLIEQLSVCTGVSNVNCNCYE